MLTSRLPDVRLVPLLAELAAGCALAALPVTDAAEGAPRRKVPIVYYACDGIVPPDAGQRREIEAVLAEAGRGPADLWFIRVREHRGGAYRAEVYFRPTSSGERVRRGEGLNLDTTVVPLAQRRAMVKQLGGDWPPTFPFSPAEGVSDADLAKIVEPRGPG